MQACARACAYWPYTCQHCAIHMSYNSLHALMIILLILQPLPPSHAHRACARKRRCACLVEGGGGTYCSPPGVRPTPALFTTHAPRVRQRASRTSGAATKEQAWRAWNT
ncbi:hypothetical protein EON67_02745 [archaeon]|nr:MAG: hypothetical protein EON67_02745 [archaeon]